MHTCQLGNYVVYYSNSSLLFHDAVRAKREFIALCRLTNEYHGLIAQRNTLYEDERRMIQYKVDLAIGKTIEAESQLRTFCLAKGIIGVEPKDVWR